MSGSQHTRSRPLVVGLTGGVGCGKSVIASEFARRGAIVISGDEVGHDVVDEDAGLQRKLAEAFGADILGKAGVNRRRLAQRAFATAEGRKQLNELVHPALVAELKRQVREARRKEGVPVIVVDAALLAEWKRQVPVDILIAVWASRANRRRWLRRRGWSSGEIGDRMRSQLPFTAHRAVADIVVRNAGSLTDLRRKGGRLWQKLLQRR